MSEIRKISEHYQKPKVSEVSLKRKLKMKKTSSKFIKVICPKCNNEQIIFGKASTEVRCSSCKKVLVELTGGKSRIKAKIVEILG